MYELLGISLSLAALLAVNVAVTMGASGLWRWVLARRARRWAASKRAGVLFALRTAPPLAATACVLTLLLPAYVAHEPRDTSEELSAKLLLVALASAACLVLAAARGLCSWRATRRLVSDWLRHAEPVRLPRVSIPSYRLRHRFPLIAVVGVLRPRLFVASQVLDSLSGEELAAAIAHEGGHLRACDNLKRAVLRACHDALLIVPCGRSLDRAWAQAAEEAADDHAASAGRRAALDLAAALVKIARSVPAGARPAMPAGAFINGETEEGVEGRVRRLLQLAEGGGEMIEDVSLQWLAWSSLSAFVAAGLLAAGSPGTLETVHTFIEHVVAALR